MQWNSFDAPKSPVAIDKRERPVVWMEIYTTGRIFLFGYTICITFGIGKNACACFLFRPFRV